MAILSKSIRVNAMVRNILYPQIFSESVSIFVVLKGADIPFPWKMQVVVRVLVIEVVDRRWQWFWDRFWCWLGDSFGDWLGHCLGGKLGWSGNALFLHLDRLAAGLTQENGDEDECNGEGKVDTESHFTMSFSDSLFNMG